MCHNDFWLTVGVDNWTMTNGGGSNLPNILSTRGYWRSALAVLISTTQGCLFLVVHLWRIRMTSIGKKDTLLTHRKHALSWVKHSAFFVSFAFAPILAPAPTANGSPRTLLASIHYQRLTRYAVHSMPCVCACAQPKLDDQTCMWICVCVRCVMCCCPLLK